MLFYRREICWWPMYNEGIISAFLQSDSKVLAKLMFSLADTNILGIKRCYTGF